MKFFLSQSISNAHMKRIFLMKKKKTKREREREREKEREREGKGGRVNERGHARGHACILEQLSKICMDNNFACIGILISMQSAACSCFRR